MAPRLVLRLVAGLCLALAASTSSAHLFTPANQSDQELLSELYLNLGVVPPRYDIVTKPFSQKSVELFSKLFSQPNGQVSRYAIPLMNSALRYWQVDSQNAAVLAEHLAHFENDHKRLVKELDREIDQAKWLLQYHQLSVSEKPQQLLSTLQNDVAHRELAFAKILSDADISAPAVLSKIGGNSYGQEFRSQLGEATRRASLPRYFEQLTEEQKLHYFEQLLLKYEYGKSTFLAYSVSRFEWLCSTLANMPSDDAGKLLGRMESNSRIERKLQIAARRYLERWRSQRRLPGTVSIASASTSLLSTK